MKNNKVEKEVLNKLREDVYKTRNDILELNKVYSAELNTLNEVLYEYTRFIVPNTLNPLWDIVSYQFFTAECSKMDSFKKVWYQNFILNFYYYVYDNVIADCTIEIDNGLAVYDTIIDYISNKLYYYIFRKRKFLDDLVVLNDAYNQMGRNYTSLKNLFYYYYNEDFNFLIKCVWNYLKDIRESDNESYEYFLEEILPELNENDMLSKYDVGEVRIVKD